MNFFQAIKSALSKYARFSGRSSRPEYGYFFLFISIGQLVSLIIDAQTGAPLIEVWGGPVFMIFNLAITIPHVAVSVRRLHDIDMSGWWILIGFLIGIILCLYLMCKKGNEGENRFGPEPLASDKKQ